MHAPGSSPHPPRRASVDTDTIANGSTFGFLVQSIRAPPEPQPSMALLPPSVFVDADEIIERTREEAAAAIDAGNSRGDYIVIVWNCTCKRTAVT